MEMSRKANVVISEDAGRYLCNYTYYLSLLHCTVHEGSSALFIHIPPFDKEERGKIEKELNDCINFLIDFNMGIKEGGDDREGRRGMRVGEVEDNSVIANNQAIIMTNNQAIIKGSVLELGFSLYQIEKVLLKYPLINNEEDIIEKIFELNDKHEEEEEEGKFNELESFIGSIGEPVKMVLVARNDLKMGKGKLGIYVNM